MKRHKDDSAFYCGEKQCRKTAWDTPEYMHDRDWEFSEKVLNVADTGDAELLEALLHMNEEDAHRFFCHCIGWPEGEAYCRSFEYLKTTGIGMLHDSAASKSLRKVLAIHKGGL